MITFAALLKNDIRIFIKDWKALALLIVMPFLFISFFVYALSPYINRTSFVEPFEVALVDKEDTAQTRMLGKQLDELQIFSRVWRVDETQARELIAEGRIAAAVIIPEKFSDSIAAGENKPVTVIGNRAMPLEAFIVRNLIQSAANIVSASQSAINTIYYFNQEAGVSGQELQKDFNDSTMQFFLEALARHEIFSRTETAGTGLDITPTEYFTSALIVVFLMFAGMPAMKLLVSERSLGLTRRLAVSPAPAWQVVLSKFLVSVMISIVQFSIIVVLTAFVFKNYWGSPVKNIILLLTGIIFAVSAWSVFVSAVSRSPASADVIGNLGILLMAVLGGSIYPLASMPGFVRYISRFTINRWAMDGFMVIFSGNEALTVTNDFLALAAIGSVFLALSAGILKIGRR